MCTELLKEATEKNIEKYCQLLEKFPELTSERVLEYLREAD